MGLLHPVFSVAVKFLASNSVDADIGIVYGNDRFQSIVGIE